MSDDSFRFLVPWTQLLPRHGGAVVAIAGSGGCTTTLLRVLDHLRSADGESSSARVLVSQTTAHPVPLQGRAVLVGERDEPERARELLEREGLVWLVGDAVDPVGERRSGVAPERLEWWRDRLRPDVVLVQAQESATASLRTDVHPPAWPLHTRVAMLVAPLAAVGRPLGAATGREEELDADGAPRRVRSEDVLAQVVSLIPTVPEGARALPFFTGFGAYRDIDGMFDLVSRLWDPPRLPVVCLAELLGDERRDAADRTGLGPGGADAVPEGERVYAVYPASLDED